MFNDEEIFSTVSLFFFQAEDGIRDLYVTGVQTCALPISPGLGGARPHARRHRRRRSVAGVLPRARAGGDLDGPPVRPLVARPAIEPSGSAGSDRKSVV